MTTANNIARIYDALAGHNRVTNGACNIVQRASVTNSGTSSTYGGPDHYYTSNSGAGGSFTQSAGTITFGGIAKTAVTQTVVTPLTSLTTTNYWHGIVNLIEGYDCYDLANQLISVSFIFNTNVSGTYSVCVRDTASPNNNSYVTSFVAVANTPARYTFQIPQFATTIANSSGIGLTIAVGFLNNATYVTPTPNQWASGNFLTVSGATNWGAVANNFIQLTELQVEAGEYCTPFEHLTFSQDYAKCQRYYQTYTEQLLIQSTAGNFGGASTFIYGVPMRTTPSVSTVNVSANGISGTPSIQVFQTNCFQIWPPAGSTIGQWCTFQMFAAAEY